MGCSAPCGFTLTMFGRRAVDDEDLKQKYERKLYIARESPEPIFDLSGCGLKTIPAGIYSICKVFRKETLLLEDNMLSTLEHGGNLSDLSCVTTLNISKNRFHSLDYSIRHLINLRELFLSHNELKFLPDSIGECVNLRILNVAQNRLKELPASLGNLKRLRKLYLTENDNLTRLCPELCNASNLILIDLDGERFVYPPQNVAVSGTIEIMRFLSEQAGVDYTRPNEDEASIHEVDNAQQLDPFNKKETSTTAWEEYERNLIKLESQIHEAGKKQRQNFLETLTQEQTRIDSEVLKIQQQRESERSALILEIQREEVAIDEIVSKLTEMNSANPQRIEQMLEYDRREQERLIEMCRTNAEIRTIDTLDAMRALLEEEYLKELSVKKYGESKSEVHRSFLIEELEASAQLSEMLTAKDESRAAFVQQLLRDEDVQKAAVASLLERVDSHSWSLIQEISIVETNLAKLSAMEIEKSKFHLDYNMQKLSDQRLQLSYLLVELLSQQEMRREQLLETLKIMELEREEAAPNFWLRSYQQLMDSVPTPVIAAQRTLDPLLANNLLQEGVIHCLPFLVKLIQSPEHLQTITSDDLKTCGVTLNSDRVAILKAIRLYLEEKAAEYEKICHIEPSAPTVTDSTTSSPVETPVETPNASPVKTEPPVVGLNMNASECVICMEESCSVVFIPCGHLCCCQKCAESVNDSCPMCRGEIERKIRVMLP